MLMAGKPQLSPLLSAEHICFSGPRPRPTGSGWAGPASRAAHKRGQVWNRTESSGESPTLGFLHLFPESSVNSVAQDEVSPAKSLLWLDPKPRLPVSLGGRFCCLSLRPEPSDK